MSTVQFYTYGVRIEDANNNDRYDAGEKIITERGERWKDGVFLSRILREMGFGQYSNTSLFRGISLSAAAIFVNEMGIVEGFPSNADPSEHLKRAENAAKRIGGPVLTAYRSRVERLYNTALARAKYVAQNGQMDFIGDNLGSTPATVKNVTAILRILDSIGAGAGTIVSHKEKKAILTDALVTDANMTYRDAQYYADRGEPSKAREMLWRLKGVKQSAIDYADSILGATGDRDAELEKIRAEFGKIVDEKDVRIVEEYIFDMSLSVRFLLELNVRGFSCNECELPEEVRKKYAGRFPIAASPAENGEY